MQSNCLLLSENQNIFEGFPLSRDLTNRKFKRRLIFAFQKKNNKNMFWSNFDLWMIKGYDYFMWKGWAELNLL